jgi:hypothetical protein
MVQERAQTCHRLHDQREALREVVSRAAIELHARAVLASDDPEAVVLDFVQPRAPSRRARGFSGQAGRDEASWKGTRTPGAFLARHGVESSQADEGP